LFKISSLLRKNWKDLLDICVLQVLWVYVLLVSQHFQCNYVYFRILEDMRQIFENIGLNQIDK
jgi:hypothetical protein